MVIPTQQPLPVRSKEYLDLIAPDLQTLKPRSLPTNLHPHLPTRVRPTAIRPSWVCTLLPPLCKYANVGHSHTHHENWEEQFPPSSSSRVKCGPLGTKKTTAADQLGGVGWLAQGLFRKEEQNIESRVFGHKYSYGNARGEL